MEVDQQHREALTIEELNKKLAEKTSEAEE
jgi:hypothetical protein